MSLIIRNTLLSNRFNLKTALNGAKLARQLSVLASKSQIIQQNSSCLLNNNKLGLLNSSISLKSYSTNAEQELHDRIDKIVKSKPIVVFMKGTADQPRCGFSRAVVQILNMHGAPFESHDVLADEQIRGGVKEYSSWPTIPQVFFNGEFIGGCDILLEMHKSGEIVDELKKVGIESKLAQEEEDEKK